VRAYFCSDIHASEKCWKKFLATPKFYDADVIIVGGDITGKFVVPIIEQRRDRWTAKYMGIDRKLGSREEVAQLEARIADAGSYAYVTTPDEVAAMERDQARVDAVFADLIMRRVHRWVDMADARLAGTGVRCFVSAANDDIFEVDGALAESDVIEDPNGKVIDLDDGLQIMGMGYGNITPWVCPRDIPEEELTQRIDDVASEVADPARTIFNLHVPPLGSGLDLAPRLDDELRMVGTAQGPEMIPVGSTAVRVAIVKYRPLVGLHGHIHESKGVRTLAGVPIANPGSEYGEGILDGLIVDIDPRTRTVQTQLVTG
jgi:Icc-related predicted phosphoesterase